MPTIVNSWVFESSSGQLNPSPFTVSNGDNRLLVSYVTFRRVNAGTTNITTPTLVYGGQVMSRHSPITRGGTSSFDQFGLALFTLSESGINAATSNVFSLTWTGPSQDRTSCLVEAYKDAGNLSYKYNESGVNNYVTNLTTSHTIVSSAVIDASFLSLVGSYNIGWNITERFQSLYGPYDLISNAFKVLSGSGVQQVNAETSGDFNLCTLASLLIENQITLASEFFSDADISDDFVKNANVYGSEVLNADAEDNYSAVFFRPGVESTQFYTEIQNTSGTWIDVSDDVLSINVYRRVGDIFRGLRKGESIVALNNWDGKYTPEIGSYDIRPTFPLRIISTYLSNTAALFTGKIEALSLNPDPGQRDLWITAKDAIKDLEKKTITTSLFSDIQVNSFVGDILDDIDVTAASVDIITNTIPVAWFADRNALNAIEEIAESGYYSAYVDGNGIFNFRNRNFELSAGSKISADEFFSLEYRKDDSRIFNRIKVGGDRRRITTDVHTLSYIIEPIFISEGSTTDFFLSYFDFQTREPVPATGLISPPTASEDVLLNETSSGTGIDYTNQCSWWLDEFSEAAKCHIYNGAGTDVYLTKFQIRGQPARKEPAIEKLREVTSSQAIYGVKDFVIDNKFIQDADYAGDYADYLKQRFDDPEPKLTMTLREENPEARKLELGNLVTATNSYLGFINKGFVIKELEHDITIDRGIIHDVTLRVERPVIDENTIIFTLSDPIKGVLNGSGQLVF